MAQKGFLALLLLTGLSCTGCAARLQLFGLTLLDAGVGTNAPAADGAEAPHAAAADATASKPAPLPAEQFAAAYASVARNLDAAIQLKSEIERSTAPGAARQQLLDDAEANITTLRGILDRLRPSLPADHPDR